MGDNIPAASLSNIRTILANYLEYAEVEIISTEQVDPDATIYRLKVDGRDLFLLEEDYVSDLDGAIARFKEYGVKVPSPIKLKAFANDASQLEASDGHSLYEVVFNPSRLAYPVLYYLAQESQV